METEMGRKKWGGGVQEVCGDATVEAMARCADTRRTGRQVGSQVCECHRQDPGKE